VTGVSGSGKSTLVRTVLHDNLRRLLSEKRKPSPDGVRLPAAGRSPGGRRSGGCSRWTRPHRQDPPLVPGHVCRFLGRRPPRLLRHARGADARVRPQPVLVHVKEAVAPSVRAGRQEDRDELPPDVKVACEACGGARFTPETLLARYKEKSIAEVLAMSVDEAAEFFAARSAIHHALRLLQDVGSDTSPWASRARR